MKNIIISIILLLTFAAGGKDLRVLTLTPNPQMHCSSCENRIKNELRFEKGVVKIETNLEKQTVKITYDGNKNDAKKLCEAMRKIGYSTTIVSDQPAKDTKKQKE